MTHTGVCISIIRDTVMECMHSAIRRARAPKAGPDRRAHCPGWPQRDLPPPPGQTRPDLSRLGAAAAPKLSQSRVRRRPPWAPPNGHQRWAPPTDPTTTPRPSAAVIRALRTPLTPLHALPPSAAACARLRRHVSAATAAEAHPGCPTEGPSAARRRRVGGAHDCERGANEARCVVGEVE